MNKAYGPILRRMALQFVPICSNIFHDTGAANRILDMMLNVTVYVTEMFYLDTCSRVDERQDYMGISEKVVCFGVTSCQRLISCEDEY